jgi:hypothetical protein
MFDSNRRSFPRMGALGQDPCQTHRDAMEIYAKKIAEFNRQMREAAARGDQATASQAAGIALDAAKKYEAARRLLEQCMNKGAYAPFRPTPGPMVTPGVRQTASSWPLTPVMAPMQKVTVTIPPSAYNGPAMPAVPFFGRVPFGYY